MREPMGFFKEQLGRMLTFPLFALCRHLQIMENKNMEGKFKQSFGCALDASVLVCLVCWSLLVALASGRERNT